MSDLIFLIGFMGAGKSTQASRLATILSYDKIDLDKRIEAESKSSIQELFESKGEEHFRDLESEILRSLEDEGDVVVACGGGTPFYNDNLDWMLANGTVVYVNTALPNIIGRLRQSEVQRPLVMTNGVLDEAKVRSLFEERREVYESAHISWDTAFTGIDELADMLS